MEKTTLNRNQVIAMLTRSPHGELKEYLPIATAAAEQDPQFFSHLIAWNGRKGSIRDSKVALPVIALTSAPLAENLEFVNNALAHMLRLSPRDMLRAVRFGMALPLKRRARLKRAVGAYLADLESNRGRFDRVALQHRHSLHELYALHHVKPGAHAADVLFKGVKVGVFAQVAALGSMAANEIAGAIAKWKIPFLVARGALGPKLKEPAVVQALIGAMTATELVTNTKALERLGVKTDAGLRAAFQEGLTRVAESESTEATLKASVAAEAVGGALGEKLKGAQEKALGKLGVEGSWLVMCDRSGSMESAIGAAREVCAILARVAKGRVHLVFFNIEPTYFEVTGMSLEEISAKTRHMTAGGGTSPACAIEYARMAGLVVDGIAVVGDANENHGFFHEAYAKYSKLLDKEPPVYVYQLLGDSPTMIGNCARVGVELSVFDMRASTDYYALPNLVQTMRTNRFSLSDEILQTPLLQLADVLRSAQPTLAQAA